MTIRVVCTFTIIITHSEKENNETPNLNRQKYNNIFHPLQKSGESGTFSEKQVGFQVLRYDPENQVVPEKIRWNGNLS